MRAFAWGMYALKSIPQFMEGDKDDKTFSHVSIRFANDGGKQR
jgi:hypothetical protein